MKVFNLSLPKTGTTTFGNLMKINNYLVCDGDFADKKTNFLQLCGLHNDINILFEFVQLYNVFSDLPWGGFNIYQQLSREIPNSKFILISRDPEDWWKSINNMINSHLSLCLKVPLDEIERLSLETRLKLHFKTGNFGFILWMRCFCNNQFNKDCFLKSKKEYEFSIIKFFENDKRLIQADFKSFVSGKSGVAKFLDCKIDNIPHSNKHNRAEIKPQNTNQANLKIVRNLT